MSTLSIADGVFTEEEKLSIINAAKDKYKESIENRQVYIRNRKVEAVLMYSEVLSAKPPHFYSGWASGTTGHWGIVVDSFLHHLVIDLDNDKKPVGIGFQGQNFNQRWVNEGKVTTKEEIGTTTLSLEAIHAIGETLILNFRDYRRVWRNAQTFADMLMQLVCDVDLKPFSSPSIQNVVGATLLAFSLTTSDYLLQTKQNNIVQKVIKKTKESLSLEDIVDAEVNDEINKVGLGIVLTIKPKSVCCSLM